MTAHILDGRALAAGLRARVAAEVSRLAAEHGLVPGLAMIKVGTDPASAVYVRSKMLHTTQAGIRSDVRELPARTTQTELLGLIAALNADPAIHGILVQLPLPAPIDPRQVIAAIDPDKDVDGFHPLNAGRLVTGLPTLTPCTPLGCLLLTKTMLPVLSGLEAIVIGRSNIVGRPLVHMLLAEDVTVTIAHSKTPDLPALTRRADLVYAATGRPELVRGSWLKPGAIVVDVGIHRRIGRDGTSKLIGDVAFAEALPVAAAITPVPGGVGPMTIACLLVNTVRAACTIAGLPAPNFDC
jgi:methylenetetrahydrofolate dehydrogenase (NADP+) / methenyltetrahydrofolate cyclohydrolase